MEHTVRAAGSGSRPVLIRARLCYEADRSVPLGRLERSPDGLIWSRLDPLGPDRAPVPAVWGVISSGAIATAHAVLLEALGQPPEAGLVAIYATELARRPRDRGWTDDAQDVVAFAAAAREHHRCP